MLCAVQSSAGEVLLHCQAHEGTHWAHVCVLQGAQWVPWVPGGPLELW